MTMRSIKLATLLTFAFMPLSFAQVLDGAREKAGEKLQAAVEGTTKKPVTNAKKVTAAKKEKIDFNAPLSVGDDLSPSQIANPLFRSRMETGCTLVSGQEVSGSVEAVGGAEAGIYLLEATCGQKTRQYLYIAKPTEGAELNEILFAQLKSTNNKTIYFQDNTRRIFFSSDNSKTLREIRWQELAKKAMSKADLKRNAAAFSKAVPKGPVPLLP